jgi:hypothetical protein
MMMSKELLCLLVIDLDLFFFARRFAAFRLRAIITDKLCEIITN